ncbi:DUF1349 domain-containing protein [Microbacterium sp. LWH7-1.2]|uniref:DUF1349 domain-containing protein n=1 Tax=Microbacterium sp. LWH7-1.2 TaxID=3135257 RepID=UPI00313A2FDF
MKIQTHAIRTYTQNSHTRKSQKDNVRTFPSEGHDGRHGPLRRKDDTAGAARATSCESHDISRPGRGARTTFDAGVLAIWRDSDHWAKLCFEYSPQGEAMVVSVVTRGSSDDVNSAVVTHRAVWLRIAFLGGDAWAFHASHDGVRWDFVRLFSLAEGGSPARVGFMAQAPLGQACTARFDEIVLREALVSNLRDGS